MAYFKRCYEKGCPHGRKNPGRCDHRYLIDVQIDGRRARGSIADYVCLVDAEVNVADLGNTDVAKKVHAAVEVWVSKGNSGRPTAKLPPQLPPDTPPPSPDGTLSLADALEAYDIGHGKGLKDKGAPTIIRRIRDELKGCAVVALLDRAKLREFLDEIEEDTSLVNRNRHLARWSHILTWTRAEYREVDERGEYTGRALYGLDGPSPFYDKHANPTGVRRKTENNSRHRRVLDAEDRALVKAMRKLDDGGMMLGRYYCARDAGLRRGEMLGLKRVNILLNYQGRAGKHVIHVPAEIAKSGKERFVPVFTDRLRDFLLTRRTCDFPFGQLDGTRLDAFREDWEGVLRESGIDAGEWSSRRDSKNGNAYSVWVRTKDGNLHWHDLRHEFGSWLHESKKVTLRQIQELLGHASLEMTQRYLNVKDDFDDLYASLSATAQASGLAKKPRTSRKPAKSMRRAA